MSKLGLIIYRIYQGLSESWSENKVDNWVRNTRDTRGDLKTISFPEDEDKVVYMMTFSDLGCYFCIVRTISGRQGDQVAAWIFIPREMDISKDELLKVIKGTTDSVLKSIIETEFLTDLFSKEYQNKAVSAKYLPSNGGSYGYRYYGKNTDYTLSELVDCIYQTIYSQFKAVFLIEKTSDIKCNGTNLTDEPLQKIVALLPPNNNTDGFEPYLESQNNAFTSPVCVALGQTVTVRWECSGYEVVHKSFVVKEDGKPAPSLSEEDYIKIVSRDEFKIVDPDGNLVSVLNCNMFISNTPIEQRGLSFKKTDLYKPMQVKIEAQGFEVYSASHNLLITPIKINLKRKRQLYQFFIPVGNNSNQYIRTEPVEFSGKASESPFKGYSFDRNPYDNGKNWECYLRFAGSTHQQGVSKSLYNDGYEAGYNDGYKEIRIGKGGNFSGIKLWIAALFAFIVGVVLTIVTNWLFFKPPMEKEQSPAAPAAISTTQQVVDKSSSSSSSSDEYTTEDIIKKANAYLDDNTKWEKTEMEKFKPLKGLFDALNSYNVNKINEIQKKLNSQKLKDITDKINNAKSGTLNTSIITVESYLKALEPKEPTVNKSAGNQPANKTSSQQQGNKNNK